MFIYYGLRCLDFEIIFFYIFYMFLFLFYILSMYIINIFIDYIIMFLFSIVGKGGKVWIWEEEFFFWKKFVLFIKKCCGDDIENNEEYGWNWVVFEMRKRMREKYLKEGEFDCRNYIGFVMCKFFLLKYIGYGEWGWCEIVEYYW